MKTRVAALDGVRGLAILMVIVYHCIRCIDTPPVGFIERVIDRVSVELWSGVDLFFVLSGYLITGILVRTRGSAGYFRNFIMRRVLRIFPLYYLFLVAMFLVAPRLFPDNPDLAKLPALQAWYWTYLPNVKVFLDGDWHSGYVDHSWSLAIEEQFYLLWPLVVALLTRRALMILCATGWIASLGLRIYLAQGGAAHAAISVLMPAHLDGLLFGALLAQLEPRLLNDLPRFRRQLLGVTGIGLLMIVAIPFEPLSYEMKHFALGITGYSLLFVGFLGLAVISPEDSILVRSLRSTPLRVLGKYSYGLYLLHTPFVNVLRPHVEALPGPASGKWVVMTLLIGTLSLALAAVVYEFFEIRFLALKRYFEPRTIAPPSAVPAINPVLAPEPARPDGGLV